MRPVPPWTMTCSSFASPLSLLTSPSAQCRSTGSTAGCRGGCHGRGLYGHIGSSAQINRLSDTAGTAATTCAPVRCAARNVDKCESDGRYFGKNADGGENQIRERIAAMRQAWFVHCEVALLCILLAGCDQPLTVELHCPAGVQGGPHSGAGI